MMDVPPNLRSLARRIKLSVRGNPDFTSSSNYWEERYRRGGNSGAGSYNRLAIFKADVLNSFVEKNHIQQVIEFGSGDGAQLELAKYPNYIGVDISESIISETRRKFASTPNIRFLHTNEVTDNDRAELALSLDVVYHLVEDDVFESYMHQLYDAAERFVIVYASNRDESSYSPHVRHRHDLPRPHRHGFHGRPRRVPDAEHRRARRCHYRVRRARRARA